MLDFSRQPNTLDALGVGPFPDACLFVKAQRRLHKCHLLVSLVLYQAFGYEWAEQYLLTMFVAHVSFPE